MLRRVAVAAHALDVAAGPRLLLPVAPTATAAAPAAAPRLAFAIRGVLWRATLGGIARRELRLRVAGLGRFVATARLLALPAARAMVAVMAALAVAVTIALLAVLPVPVAIPVLP